jgi:UDP-N-acetylmuramoyl-tripeptide--D-alanyl-D-alanine ligase
MGYTMLMYKTIRSFFAALGRLYSWGFPSTILKVYRTHDNSPWRLLAWFWQSNTFTSRGKIGPKDHSIVVLLLLLLLAQVILGVWLLVEWARYGSAGYLPFGVATLVSYPLVQVHVVAFASLVLIILRAVLQPKKAVKSMLGYWMERDVIALRKKHHFKLIAVAGSVGKTSTKLAIAELLGQTVRVRYQKGNYNDRLTVPLVFFGQKQPGLYNIFAWFRVLGEQAALVHQPYDYDVVVVEIGTDGPGQIKNFAYLKPDITVVTAITPEHMVYFGTIDAVAKEELTVFDFSKKVLVNADDIPGKYLAGKDFVAYSLTTNLSQNYYAKPSNQQVDGQQLALDLPSGKITAKVSYAGQHGAKVALAAASVAELLAIAPNDIETGLEALQPFAGRMQLLAGQKNSVLIDDSYNSTPIAAKAALDVLYGSRATQKIAILGSMNELGDYSKQAHEEVGEYCDGTKIDMVVTIGTDAKRWIAPAARASGCVVHCYVSPYEAGHFVRKQLKEGALVLVKGSQNGVFAEEALKQLLAHPSDREKLVRQGPYWLKLKKKQFKTGTL